ncbi:MAG TPA: chemotaxis protein CheA [Gammaproteobacteria bacterium]|nr:chemotaxis protein CheA [Gammaproteobacteria bacterium]
MTDLAQFHDVFFEESRELLDGMEAALLALADAADDLELINTVFRTAHSIKGGAATFGFSEIAEFTHSVESVLDLMRSGKLTIDQPGIDLLLKTVDVTRAMLNAQQAGQKIDPQAPADLQFDLELYVHQRESGAAAPAPAPQAEAATNNEQAQGWDIRFRPLPGMLKKGNDPAGMFGELEKLGELERQVDMSRLPALADMDPEECYLAWDLGLVTEADRGKVAEVFDWVEGDCELQITPRGEMAAPAPAAAEPVAAPVETASAKPAKADPPRAETAAASSHESASIRVNIEKVDQLINLVGELVITQAMLNQFGGVDGGEKLRAGLVQLERNTRELQESVMQIRMLPISFLFSRYPRMVRDLASKLHKKIELKVSGDQTELDKTVLEKLGDPLVHLVRNSIDHGIEMPEQRLAAGKPETGTVHLNAFHRGGSIVVEISDDGRGLDRERILKKARDRGLIGPNESPPDEQVFDLIFAPGFSTAEQATDVSGRGVGMDVVRRNIRELGGHVELRSKQGAGTTITITLPLTLAIMDGQSLRVGGEQYILPLTAIIESVQVTRETVRTVAGRGEVVSFRGEYLPVIRLHEVLGSEGGASEQQLVVIVEGDNRRAGLVVDELLGQQQVVIKSLEANFRRVAGLSGATILGDGAVALILDVPGLIRLANTARAA